MKKFCCSLAVCLIALCFVCGAFADDQSQTQGQSGQGSQEIITVDPEKKVGDVDIVFFIDQSGSMQDEIDAVKENLIAFSNSLATQGVAARFAIIAFHDNENKVFDFSGSHWTTNVKDVESSMGTIRAHGDERITRALNTVLDWSDFNSEALKVGFLLTDEPTASYYSYRYGDPELSELVEPYKTKGIQLTTITKQHDKEHYRIIYEPTGGVWIDIDRPDFYKSMLDLASWITETITIPEEKRLPATDIEPVSTSAASTVASEAGIPVESIDVLTTDTSSYFDISLPHDLVSRDEIEKDLGIEFLSKLNTVILYSESLASGDWGYFLFGLTLPDDAKLTGLKVGNSTSFSEHNDGFLDFMIFDTTGKKLDTISGNKILILVYGETESAITPYLVKKSDEVKFWIMNASDFGDYANKNRSDIVEELKDRAKALLNKIFGDDGSGGGGCDTGFGLIGLAILGTALIRKH